MNTYRHQLQAILRVCQVTNATTFTWFGAPETPLPRHLRGLPAADARRYLHHAVQNRIYQDAYTLGSPQPPRSEDEFPDWNRDRSFAEALASANTAQGCWEPGWTVIEPAAPLIGVHSGNLRLWVKPNEVQGHNGDPVKPGDSVQVRMPRGSFDLSPGFYSAFSDTPATQLSRGDVIRIYIATQLRSASSAMHTITRALNTAELPFRLKMLSDPARYDRADSAVLYLSADDIDTEQGRTALRAALDPLLGTLRSKTPMFTQRLVDGIGVAEEPPGNQSFGERLSSVIADGILSAAEHGIKDPAPRMEAVLDACSAAGISMDAPYRKEQSPPRRYESLGRLLTFPHHQTPSVSLLVSTPAPDVAVVTPLASRRAAMPPETVAAHLAQRLVDDAVWHEDQATWVGVVPTTDDHGQPALAHGAVGRTLYDGSAGISLFLAFVAAQTGSEPARHTAQAAARQCLAATLSSPAYRGGLYLGLAGRIVAAAATGLLTGDHELSEHAYRQAIATSDTAHTVDADLLSGSAGTILAFLTLAQLFDEDKFTSTAVQLGDDLIATAHRSSDGWSWAGPHQGDSLHLTGLSHGASGIGAAFVELAALTNQTRFADAARAAFSYERQWFDPSTDNWPDLRGARRRAQVQQAPVFRTQWCHGAPGIALSRLRAADVLTDPLLAQEAATALRSTQRDTETVSATGSLSFSLCHGLIGNADVLLSGATFVDASTAAALGHTIDKIASAGVERHVNTNRPWPCGVPVPDLEVPGLLLGLAGIGYHYLRLAHRDTLPSVLLLHPSRFADQVHHLSAAPRTLAAQRTSGV